MSAALWCDKGGHAFSDRDPGHKKMVFTEKVKPADGVERPVEVRQDLCGDCAAEVTFASAAPREITA